MRDSRLLAATDPLSTLRPGTNRHGRRNFTGLRRGEFGGLEVKDCTSGADGSEKHVEEDRRVSTASYQPATEATGVGSQFRHNLALDRCLSNRFTELRNGLPLTKRISPWFPQCREARPRHLKSGRSRFPFHSYDGRQLR